MSEDPAVPRRSTPTKFTLRVQNCALEVSAALPEGEVPAEVLLPVIQGLSERLAEIAAHSAAQAGRPVSCHEGCGACCRHAVPITPTEARTIAAWMEEQPEERQAVLRERFRQAAAKLEESGVAERIRQAARVGDSAEVHGLGLRYFALGLTCPFLEEERCTIHPIRPLRCREYLAVSPAENCGHPESATIVSIKPPLLLSQAVTRWNPRGELEPGEMILLTMMDEWLERHPLGEEQARRSAGEWLQEFLAALGSEGGGGQLL
jgi:Fe-S-cluster containining protein